MTLHYTITHQHDGVVIQVIAFDRKPWRQTHHNPTDATLGRFTAIAESAMGDREVPRGTTGRHITAHLLKPSDGFGFEIWANETRLCGCGRQIHEGSKEWKNDTDCFMCEINKRIAAGYGTTELDRITAPLAPHHECQTEADGDQIYA